MPNPLAIDVTVGGLFLDAVAPRFKPRAGVLREFSLLSARPDPRTPRRARTLAEHGGTALASGHRS